MIIVGLPGRHGVEVMSVDTSMNDLNTRTGLSFQYKRLPNEPIGNSTFTFSVKDGAGAAVVGFEYRLYVKDAADGIIGTVELDGAESYGLSTRTFPYAYYTTPMTVELQIIKDGYEESLVEYVLHQTAQNVTVSLRTERNI